MKSKKLSYNKILVLFCIIVVSVLMTGCNGGAPPMVNIFSASPSTINPGESSTLTWSVSEADTVTITPGVGTVDLSGIISVSPVVTTVYTLTATNSAGGVTATATVNVQAPPVHNLTKNTYYNTIQAALDDADSDNTIEVTDGTYDETIYFPSGKKVILQSVNGPSSTTIRGDHKSSTVNLGNSLPGTTIEGFTITHAVGLSGSGIYNGVGNLTIYNCTISNNIDSGGIYNAGILTITASTISGNTDNSSGGGIYNDGTLTITGASTISGNTANYNGGGILNSYGTITITASTISGNTANLSGGGIYNDGILTITASTISGNSGDFGGGIFNSYGTGTITASTISGNSADYNGGGIYILMPGSFVITIGGSSSAEKNTICGNYKSGNSPSLDQQIRCISGDLYGTYKDTNYIGIYCPIII